MYAILGQEFMLHQVPLLLLMTYNNWKLGKKFDDSDLSIACLVISAVHITLVMAEFSYHRYWLNRGVNAEKRFQKSAYSRAKDA